MTEAGVEVTKVEEVAELFGITAIETADEVAIGVSELELPDAEDPEESEEPEEPDVRPPMPLTAAQVPLAACCLEVPALVTSGPGFGMRTSVVSMVVQPFARFATNISGRLVNAVFGAAPVPAAMVMDAQFW
jgi:hypothetical protein